MMRKIVPSLLIVVTAALVTVSVFETDAFARVGGSRSIGSRGTRSYSPSGGSYSRPAPTQSPSQPASPYQQPAPSPQPAGGGFFRSMAGGLLGGMLGGMLFRSLGFGGGGFGGSGIGLFEIILIAGIGYMLYRMVTRRQREAVSAGAYGQESYRQDYQAPPVYGGTPSYGATVGDVATGLAHIRQMDASFDEERFSDQVMDIFFKIQGAWMNRDLAPAASLLTEEMRGILQGDVDNLLREKRVNRLENIAVRNVDIVEAWQETGQDYVTALIYANLLDYTTDDTTGQVVAGSRTEPVKFEEYWTFARPVGNNPWRLAAINQK